MSMITHFMGTRSRVKSIQVPYLCTACKQDHLQVIEVTTGMQVAPAMSCPRCGASASLDDLAEMYNEALLRV
jgi:DNA-directed RNA polymerase subunit RPC12/RpoP